MPAKLAGTSQHGMLFQACSVQVSLRMGRTVSSQQLSYMDRTQSTVRSLSFTLRAACVLATVVWLRLYKGWGLCGKHHHARLLLQLLLLNTVLN